MAASHRGPDMWQRLASPFKVFGPLAGLLYLIDRLLQRLSPKLGLCVYELMVQPIVAKPLLPATLAKHLRYRAIEPGGPPSSTLPVCKRLIHQESTFNPQTTSWPGRRSGSSV